jgi:hypothetical protein
MTEEEGENYVIHEFLTSEMFLENLTWKSDSFHLQLASISTDSPSVDPLLYIKAPNITC